MAGTLNNGMCRCCASEGSFRDISSKYVWMGEEEIYAEMLRECFDINLVNAESHDGGICEVCITQLRSAANFKKQVQITEEQFKKRINDNMFKNNIVKVEVNMLDEDDHHSDNNDNNLSDDFSGPEFEVPVKTESEEVKGKKRTRATAARTKKAKLKGENDNAESSKRKQIKQQDAQIKLVAAKNRENLKTILLHSNASLIKNKTDKGYSCVSCPKLFQKPYDLKRHFLQEHRGDIKKMKLKSYQLLMKVDVTNLECDECTKRFGSLQSFTSHLPEHNLNFHTDIENQIIPLRFDSDAYKCAVCDSEFVTFNALLKHTNGHFSNIKCEQCGAGFVILNHYLRHKDKHEQGEYKCNHCDKTFTTKNNRSVHERITHLGIKKNKCSICSKRFSTHWSKVSHMVKEHGEAAELYKIECNACDRVFTNKAKLRQHIKSYHLMIGRCVCPICNKVFYSKQALIKHSATHQREKMFECDICGKRSVSKNSLKEHIRTHSNSWRYSCSVCDVGFAQSSVMKAHMATKKHMTKMNSVKL